MMWNRKRLLNWNPIRFGQTSGTAHQESRSPGKWTTVQDTRQIDETGNVLSTIQSQGRQKKTSFGTWFSATDPNPPGNDISEPEGRFVPEARSRDRTKGQQEGKAVTGIAGMPGADPE